MSDRSKLAFPLPIACTSDGQPVHPVDYGMTIREWYAGMAMQGLLANPKIVIDWPDEGIRSVVAAEALRQADAMLAEASETTEKGA